MNAARRPRVVFVHAHPDDELLATGALLTASVTRGCDVMVVTCTLGEEGEVIPPESAHLEGAGERFAQHRWAELSGALDVLDLTPTVLPHPEGGRFRDSGMAGSEAASHPRALAAAPTPVVAAALGELLHEFAPDAVVTYDPRGGYDHPDHIAVHRATVAAARNLAESRPVALYAATIPRAQAEADRAWIHARQLGEPWVVPNLDDPHAAAVVPEGLIAGTIELCTSEEAMRAAALEHHRTQVTVHDGWFALSNLVAQRLSPRDSVSVLDLRTGGLVESGRAMDAWWQHLTRDER